MLLIRKKSGRNSIAELELYFKLSLMLEIGSWQLTKLAIPIVTYGFNILNWAMSETKRLDDKVRKLLTRNKMHHPKANIDRLYIRRSEGGK